MKRGQITIFMIVGAVIIILAVLAVYFGEFNKEGLKQPGLERFSPVELFIQGCLDSTAKKVFLYNMKQGGYNVVNEGIELEDFMVVPYYLGKGVVSIPTKDVLEEELVSGLDDIEVCLDFSSFEEFSIDKGENEFYVSILDDMVMVNANIPIKATFNNITRNFDVFNTVLNVDAMNLVGAASDYVDIQKSDVNVTFVGGIADIAYNKGLGFDIINLDEENAVIYLFSDGKIDDKEAELMFAVKK